MPPLSFFRIVQYLGISLQLFSELIEGVKTLFCLADKAHVADESVEDQGIVYVGDGDFVFPQCLAIQHVLISILLEAFVQRMFQHDVALDDEVGGVEMAEIPTLL